MVAVSTGSGVLVGGITTTVAVHVGGNTNGSGVSVGKAINTGCVGGGDGLITLFGLLKIANIQTMPPNNPRSRKTERMSQKDIFMAVESFSLAEFKRTKTQKTAS